MILDKNSKQRPDIEYPCKWEYKVISSSAEAAINSAEKAAKGFEYEIKSSNVSSQGKYVSINLAVQVESEGERNIIFGKLENDNDVIMVL